MEQIVLAFSKDDTAEKIRRMLDGSGYGIAAVCHSFAEIMRIISDMDEALIIMGYKLPDAVVDDVAENLSEGQKLMSIMKPERRELVTYDDVFVVPLPVNRQELISAIDVLWGALERRRRKPKRTPEEEKIIEQAKLYLMDIYHMTEEQAHRFIQKRSMDMGAKFIDTARQILNI
jgi:response regulator NasT